jgi:hypothetical protein
MVDLLERRFNSWVLLTKATESFDDWIVSGPVADVDVADYDGETLVKAGVMRGLELHGKLGGHIDYEHQYPKTKDPKWLIGKSVEVSEVDGKPWLTVLLHKAGPGAELARKVWDSVKNGIRMGFSIWGSGVKDRLDPKRIIDTKIMMVTIAPSPKGFGQFLQAGEAPAGLYAIAKALTDDGVVLGIEDDWTEIEKAETEMWPPIAKALTTGDGIVQPGEQGGPALRSQYLKRGLTPTTYGDRDDSKLRKRRRKKKRTAAIEKALSDRGIRNPSAVAARVIALIDSRRVL